MYDFDSYFPRYDTFAPQVPVWCLTPHKGCYTHRFFDTVPISPSGRYLAVLNMPYEDRCASLNDPAEILVIDLTTGEEKVVAHTTGWEHQMGANINWGADDTQLIYNDVEPAGDRAFALRLNPQTGEKFRLEHEIYHASPDGLWGVSANLCGMQRTQIGYGVPVDEAYIPANTIDTGDDGVWLTDTQTGKTHLLLSLKQIFETTHSDKEREFYRKGLCFVFHTKWSPNGKRIMFSTRWVPSRLADMLGSNSNDLRFCVYTCNRDGSDLQVAIDETQWVKGGHHTTWSPDSDFLTMNLNIEMQGMRFCRASLTGRHVENLFDELTGSGHPSLHPSGKVLITDTYAWEPVSFGDGSVPLRVIDAHKGEELAPALRINVKHIYYPNGPSLRVDPHPVWDRTGRYCVFNGHPDDCRRVFIADMSRYL